jgi:hypothetical protein
LLCVGTQGCDHSDCELLIPSIAIILALKLQGQGGRRLLMVPEDSSGDSGQSARRQLLADNEAEHQALLQKLAAEHKDRLAQADQTKQQQTQDQQHTAQQLQQQQQQEQQQLHKGSASGQQQVNQQQQQAEQQQAHQQGGSVFAEDAGQVKQDAKQASTSLGAENAADNELSEEVPKR